MEKRIPYSLYKTGYHQFPASAYDPLTKTILVDMPPVKRRVWPKEWKRIANSFRTPGGCTVYFWNTGLSQNYLVERFITPHYSKSKTIPAGFDSFNRVLDTVAEFEGCL